MRGGNHRESGWRIGAGLALITVVAVAPYLGSELFLLDGGLGFPLDDSFIHLVFARSLAGGDGLSFQAGHLVTGSTAPLWTGLLSLVLWLPGSPLAWAKVLGGVAHLGTVWTSFLLARELGVRKAIAAAAAGVVALTGWLVWSAMAAMEVPLFTLLGTGAMILHLRERRGHSRTALSLGLFGLACLVRPEGALLLLLALIDRTSVLSRHRGELRWRSPDRRILGRGLALTVLIVGPVALLYLWIGGSPLPSTYFSKLGQGGVWGWPSVRYLALVGGILFQSQPVAAFLAPAGIVILVGRIGSREDRGLLLPLWVVGLPMAYAILASGRTVVGNFGRYFFPLFPVLVLLAALAVDEMADRLPSRIRLGRLRTRWKAVAGAILLLPSLYGWIQGAGRYSQSVLNVEDSDVRMAHWIRKHIPETAVLAVNDIGAFGWYLENPLVDLAGLVTPEVHEYVDRAKGEGRSVHQGLMDLVEAIRPDYLVAFPGWVGPMIETGKFEPVIRLEIPDNITMGDDELVLCATPWTRELPRDLPVDPPEARP